MNPFPLTIRGVSSLYCGYMEKTHNDDSGKQHPHHGGRFQRGRDGLKSAGDRLQFGEIIGRVCLRLGDR